MNSWTVMLEFPFQIVLCVVLPSNTVGIFYYGFLLMKKLDYIMKLFSCSFSEIFKWFKGESNIVCNAAIYFSLVYWNI